MKKLIIVIYSALFPFTCFAGSATDALKEQLEDKIAPYKEAYNGWAINKNCEFLNKLKEYEYKKYMEDIEGYWKKTDTEKLHEALESNAKDVAESDEHKGCGDGSAKYVDGALKSAKKLAKSIKAMK